MVVVEGSAFGKREAVARLDTSEGTFGGWLRRRRRALDLTQQELADCAGCSLVTIRKFEADERRPSKLLAELLADCLNVPADERERFIAFARQTPGTVSLPPPVAASLPTPIPSVSAVTDSPRPSSLPAPLTTLVGREDDVAALVSLLERPGVRLVTMTGPGGTGKTRLAIDAARTLADRGRYADGVWFIDLTAVADPGLVLSEIAQALGVKEQADAPIADALARHLAGRETLLVLDNFEQVVGAAGDVVGLLSATLGLWLLVTSRELLRVYGEHEYPVGPLGLPPPRESDPDRLIHYPAVALFVQRSAAVRANFALTAENAPAVVEICRRLDGLPLAIELAAARSKLFSPPTLLAQLGSSLDLSARVRHLSERQRTLRGAIEWSYRLLDEDEQRFFRKLGVFAGPFATADAAALVGGAADEWTMAETLAGLVDKSVVQPVETGRALRFRLLVVLRDFAQEQLALTGELDAARQAHARHYLALAGAAAPLLEGKEQVAQLAALSAVLDDIRAVLAYSLEAQDRCLDGLRLATLLRSFWRFRGLFSEGRGWLRQLLDAAPPDAPADVIAGAYSTMGMLARYQDDHEEALRLLHASLDHWRSLGEATDRRQMVIALRNIAAIHYWRDELEQSERYSLEILAIDREMGNQSAVATMLGNLASINKLLGRFDLARQYQTEALALHRQVSGTGATISSLNGLGLLEFHEGHLDEAARLYDEALGLARDMDDPYHESMFLSNLAEIGMVRGQLGEARALLEKARDLARAGNYTRLEQTSLFNLGVVRLLEGGPVNEVWPQLRDPLRYWQEAGINLMIDVSLYPIALMLSRGGRFDAALRLVTYVDAHTRNPVRSPDFEMMYHDIVSVARDTLSEVDFAAAEEGGRALTSVDACALALAEGEIAAAGVPAGASAAPRPYRTERFLAAGGMGAVYLGRDDATGTPVVVKRLRPEFLAGDPTALARFRREAEILRAMDHPAVVRVLHVSEEPPEIVMEYVQGGTLRDLLEYESRLAPSRAVAITRTLAEALAQAHAAGVIHRDLKPENVLLATDGSPRLSDFGLAFRPGGATRLTEPDTLIGTVAYLSPEACRGQEPDARNDVWALGVVLVEMLTGVNPFARDNAAATVLAIVQSSNDSLLGAVDIPAPLVELVRRVLAADPARRPPDASALLEALDAASAAASL